MDFSVHKVLLNIEQSIKPRTKCTSCQLIIMLVIRTNHLHFSAVRTTCQHVLRRCKLQSSDNNEVAAAAAFRSHTTAHHPRISQAHIASIHTRTLSSCMLSDWIGLCSVLRPHQHSIGYMGDSFTGQKTQPTVSKLSDRDSL